MMKHGLDLRPITRTSRDGPSPMPASRRSAEESTTLARPERVGGIRGAAVRKRGFARSAGQALYVDQNFALRQPNTEKYLSYRMTPEERATWFEHNT